MQCSLEISMYPLKGKFKNEIINFILELRKYPNLKIVTNGMSTQVFGTYKDVMYALNTEIEKTFLCEDSIVFSLKIINNKLDTIPKF